MNSIGFWSVIVILYQTIICVIISWFTLSCRLSPEPTELHEVTLMKLLYLYEPEACGRIFFYNYTGEVQGNTVTTVVWPMKNDVAGGFRSKIKVWLSLHIVWSFLSILNMLVKDRPCGLYAVLLPFTITGLTMIVLDMVYGILFLIDARYTGNENDILEYLNRDVNNIDSFDIKKLNVKKGDTMDTSWISVLFAYISFRGIVQLIINFWIVKDNYFNGVETYLASYDRPPGRRKLYSFSVPARIKVLVYFHAKHFT
ncbi:hypothetical protein K1T71_001494 [Dendrolimus kikuchii]|uniref:Uncharacterized protein n=1 Tax=Dendrolimus kikuchii TaxID=765133 RepID=A0ACC1DHV0_9NEOP|nr:hypothetical protein K1T71_001494 [Dendrolimus kikuchii]